MEKVSIRELKTRASELVRAVKERRAQYVIAQRGEPVAILLPVDAVTPPPDPNEVWARLEMLGREIAKNWQSEKSAVEILSEMRR